MAMSPDDLRNKTFSIVKKGYERGEVHRFLGSVADELQAYNRAALSDNEIVIADVVGEQGPETASIAGTSGDDRSNLFAETVEEGAEPDVSTPTPSATSSSSRGDDFDRVGNEISLMLRQAQESSIKIRSDAEAEARTLVDQVRLDIEADRLAHEQAAADLVARTEERASAMRTDAEEYAAQVRTSADEYADSRRSEADADRTAAAATLANAEEEAAASLAEAFRRAEEIAANIESEASARAEEILAEAQATLASLTDAERESRESLKRARKSIDNALGKLESPDS